MSKILRFIHLALIAVLLAGPTAAQEEESVAVTLNPENFHSELDRLRQADGSFPDGTRFVLAPGDYHLEAEPYSDPSCGNCEDPDTTVVATLGLRLAGRGIVMEGPPEGELPAVIRTHAGYGILFQDCEDCALSRVTVTDGVRDPDPRATDAAVVVQRSRVSVEDCHITENLGDSTLLARNIVGIIGIAGREGAKITIKRNRIQRNSWDGVALYRGAEARIERNIIDGVDRAAAASPGGGRGVGVGVTWDAKARVLDNTISRYWKGVGVFVDADVLIRKNFIEEMSTWGIAVWDAGKGRPRARIEGNIIHDTGACGVSVSIADEPGSDTGHLIYNAITRTGQDPKYDAAEDYCAQCPIAVTSRPAGFEIEGNVLHDNRRAPTDAGMEYPDVDLIPYRLDTGRINRDLPVDGTLYIDQRYPKPVKR